MEGPDCYLRVGGTSCCADPWPVSHDPSGLDFVTRALTSSLSTQVFTTWLTHSLHLPCDDRIYNMHPQQMLLVCDCAVASLANLMLYNWQTLMGTASCWDAYLESLCGMSLVPVVMYCICNAICLQWFFSFTRHGVVASHWKHVQVWLSYFSIFFLIWMTNYVLRSIIFIVGPFLLLCFQSKKRFASEVRRLVDMSGASSWPSNDLELWSLFKMLVDIVG